MSIRSEGKQITRLPIDWSDLDLFGHVNNVAYFRYIQSARVQFWEQTGLYKHHTENNIGPVLASCSCTFLKPLFYPGEIQVETYTNTLGNSSFSFRHTIYNQHEEAVASAEDVMFFFDFNLNKTLPLPESFRNALTSDKS